MPKKAAKANRLVLSNKEDEALSKAPHTMVFSRGKVGNNITELSMDIRKMMEPYTASDLTVQKNNVLNDFVGVAAHFNVTNLLSFHKTDIGTSFRLARLPKGPTITFRVKKYSLCKDIVTSLKRPLTYEEQFRSPPVLVMNNFTSPEDSDKSKDINYVDPLKLCSTMVTNMFPTINVHEVNLNNVKRVVEFSVTEDREHIEVRHYGISVKPVGVSKKVKKLMGKSMPNLNNYDDVGDYLLGNASASESEAEDDTGKVELPQKMSGAGNMKNHQSAIRLTELGPRMTLELVKVQDGMCEGKVLFHKYVDKTEEELKDMEANKLKKQKEKAYRIKVQEDNIKKKEAVKEKNKALALEGMKRKQKEDAKKINEEPPEKKWRRGGDKGASKKVVAKKPAATKQTKKGPKKKKSNNS